MIDKQAFPQAASQRPQEDGIEVSRVIPIKENDIQIKLV